MNLNQSYIDLRIALNVVNELLKKYGNIDLFKVQDIIAVQLDYNRNACFLSDIYREESL